MHDVFISYSTMDLGPAEKIRDVLEQNKIPCWMAPRDIPSGSNYAKEIPMAIRECKVFLLILSANAQNSNWVVKELDNAVNAGKIIIPLMLEDCPLNDEFNFLLTGAQRYTSYRRSEETLKMLIKQIQAITGIEPEQAAFPDREEKPVPAAAPVLEAKPAAEKKPDQKKQLSQEAVNPVVHKAKPVKVRPKKEKIPFAVGKTEALAALAIPAMVLLTLSAYVVGNWKYFYWNRTLFYQEDYKLLAVCAIVSVVIGVAMWWEWIRFRHREKKENPEAPACPSCGSHQVRISTFRTRWMTGKERCALLLIPISAALGYFGQIALARIIGRKLHVYFFSQLQLQCIGWTGIVQGLIVGCWLANLLVRYLRRKSGLCSAVCRCSQCRSSFLPVIRKHS